MFKNLHKQTRLQLVLGFLMGICFGFLLQRGGVTKYNIIMAQLFLEDFTVVKIMLTAVVAGMIGIYVMRDFGLVKLHPKPGSVGSSLIGGLIFGVGFAILGYCPGTVSGAVGQGSLDALFGGVAGLLLGAGIYARLYPRLEKSVLQKGDFGKLTLPELLRVNHWLVIIPLVLVIVGLFVVLERAGL